MRKFARYAVIVAGLGILPVLAQDAGEDEDDGGGFLERRIEGLLSSDTMSVEVSGFEGALSSRATMDRIVFSDENGTWLTVNDAVLDWSRASLLRGRLQINELGAREILLPRLPQGERQAEPPSPEAQPFSLPELPVSINIDQLAVDRVELGEPVIGEAAALSLDGSASLAGGSGEVNVEAARLDGEQGQFNIAGSFDNDSRELTVDVGIDEAADGIVANLIDLPGRPSVALDVEGSGPLSDFAAEIDLQTDGEPRLAGTVELMGEEGATEFAVDLGGDVTALFNPEYRPFFGENVQLSAQGTRRENGAFDLSSLDLTAQSLQLRGQVSVGADGVPDLIDVTGRIGAGEGPVLLPVGQDIEIGRVGLDVQFDASESEDWTGEIVVENLDMPDLQAERVALDGSGIIAGANETLDVEAGFDFTAAGLTLPDAGLEEALGEEIEGRIELGYEAGDPITLDLLRLAGAGFSLEGEGQVDPDGENVPLALTAALDAQDLSVFSALAGRQLSGAAALDLDLEATALDGGFDVTLDGETRDLSTGTPQLDPLLVGTTAIDLAAERDRTGLRVSRLGVDNEALDLSGNADLTSDGGTAEASLRVDDLGRIDPELSGPATLDFSAERPADEWDVTLRASGAEAEVAGDAIVSQLDAESPLANFDLSVEAVDLGNFSVFVGRELGGSVDLRTRGQARLDASLANVSARGTMTDVALGVPELDALLAGTTEIEGNVDRSGSRIEVPVLRIENPQIAVTGEADVMPGDSEVSARIALAELSRIVPQMSGPATLTLDADEGAEGWTVDLDGAGAGSRIVADALVKGLRDAGTAPLVDGSAEVSVADLSVFSQLADRELGGSLDLTVEGQGRTDLSTAQARVSGRMQDVALGQPELDRLLAGRTELAFEGSKDGAAIRVPRLEVTNPQVGVTGEGQYGTGQGAVQAKVDFPDLGAIVPAMSGAGEIAVFAEETGDEAWQVSLDGDGAGVVLDVMAQVSDLGAVPLVDGEITLAAEDLSRFSSLANRELTGSVNLDADIRARTDASTFDVSADARSANLRLGVPQADQLFAGGETTLDLAASREGMEAPIRIGALNLDAPGLDVTANGQVLGGASDLTLDATLADLGAFVPGLNGALRVQGDVGQNGENITLDIGLDGPQGTNARIGGSVAQSFDRADLSVTGSAPLALANPFISPRSLSGTAQFDLGLDGPLAPSSLTGTVTLSDGRVVAPTLPAVLNNVNGTARIEGNEVQLDITAAKQAGGQIRVSGPISLQPGYAADIGIELSNLVFEDPRLYRTTLNGQVGITGPLTGGATIGGTVRLGETELRVPSTGLGATGPIPDGLVHRNEPQAVYLTRRRAGLVEEEAGDEAESGGGIAFPLDLTILAENRIFIRGRGLDAELGGQLEIGGTTANVVPSGQFELIRGRLDLLGQRITLTEGYVTLQGNFDPVIRLVAETETDEVTVFIIVSGQATEPEIEFSSSPELPQDEVLARLLFGRSIDEISPLQAAQLASAVATLAGRGGGGVINNLRNSTGLDDLDVTTDEEGNVGLQAGKYISDNIYTDVTVDSTGEAEINLNLDVTESVTVRGGAANDGDTSLGVFFERDY